MLTLTSVQLNAWIAAFIYPTVRIMAFSASAPFFSNSGLPRRTRLMLGLALSLAIAPILPPAPHVIPGSMPSILLLLEQVLIGTAMGFSMRLIFAGIDMAGQVMGAQMGLGFATFYDPLSSSQTVVVANFLTMLATLLFLSMDGHLIYFATLAESFRLIPISLTPPGAGGWHALVLNAQIIFGMGLTLSMPVVTVLLITNMALGVLNRAAPQLNLFAIGFPITLTLGFGALAISLGYMAAPLQHWFEHGLTGMLFFSRP